MGAFVWVRGLVRSGPLGLALALTGSLGGLLGGLWTLGFARQALGFCFAGAGFAEGLSAAWLLSEEPVAKIDGVATLIRAFSISGSLCLVCLGGTLAVWCMWPRRLWSGPWVHARIVSGWLIGYLSLLSLIAPVLPSGGAPWSTMLAAALAFSLIPLGVAISICGLEDDGDGRARWSRRCSWGIGLIAVTGLLAAPVVLAATEEPGLGRVAPTISGQSVEGLYLGDIDSVNWVFDERTDKPVPVVGGVKPVNKQGD